VEKETDQNYLSLKSIISILYSRLRQFVHPAAYSLEFSLPGKFVPDGLRILIRRRDGHDSRLAAAAHRTHSDPRLIVELDKFQYRFLNALSAALSSCGLGLEGCDGSEDKGAPE
jgi:hypothetical protein